MSRPKVAIVDHSYHERTKSTEFLFDLFREHFDVEVYFDDGWKSRRERFVMGGLPLRGDYEWIVFLQVFPPPGILRFLKCKKILCVPMLDGMIGLPPEFFAPFRNCYFLSFSKTLHDFLNHLGHRSVYLQYFPEVSEKVAGPPGDGDASTDRAAFFWQRRTPVTAALVKELLGDDSPVAKLHLHKKADPGFEFLEETEVSFPGSMEVTTSTWLETREEFHQLMAESGIFFAPREYEGIGMSFLEAMGLGKCVIAPDRPTANEYIEHGVNGLLYDPANPEVLDLGAVGSLRRSAALSAKEGRQVYLAKAHELLRALAVGDLRLFNECRLAGSADPEASFSLRTAENLNLIREYTSRPWVLRVLKRYLTELICLAGLVLTRSGAGRRQKSDVSA